jgi:hypothetical protein
VNADIIGNAKQGSYVVKSLNHNKPEVVNDGYTSGIITMYLRHKNQVTTRGSYMRDNNGDIPPRL